jgi:O-acetyl-ADP-ribose deacetylase (regulator of RNase III)
VIRVEVGEIAAYDVDAIVRPATDTLAALAEDAAEGEATYHVRQPLAIGAAVVTAAQHGAADFVIHAVLASDRQELSSDGLRLALESVVHQAHAWRFARLAMPLLGTERDGLPATDAADVLAEVLAHARQAAADPLDVCIVVGSEEDRSIVEAQVRRWLAHES